MQSILARFNLKLTTCQHPASEILYMWPILSVEVFAETGVCLCGSTLVWQMHGHTPFLSYFACGGVCIVCVCVS